LSESDESKKNKMNNSTEIKKEGVINVFIQDSKTNDIPITHEANLAALKQEEAKDLEKLPLNKIGYMIISYIIMLFITLIKGSNYSKSLVGIQR
jgi:hypothetical protein